MGQRIDPAKAGVGAAPARVLIVEPNRNYLTLLARRISEAGYRVATADGAQSALAELHRMPVDLIIAEINMPQTSGVELVRMIRDDAVHRDLPLILITGRSDKQAAVRALDAGADDVVVKPFHFEVLIARIGRQLKRAQAVKALRDANATLDARVVTRSIELGEMRDRLAASEAERLRLEGLVGHT
jgi:DNA-binding response OmpR family regulator